MACVSLVGKLHTRQLCGMAARASCTVMHYHGVHADSFARVLIQCEGAVTSSAEPRSLNSKRQLQLTTCH